MSHYADYIREHRGDGIIENEKGFATYRFLNEGKSVYIVDIYIHPDFRHDGAASIIADSIVDVAKAKGCTELLGTVVPTAKNSTASLKVLLGYGMSLQSSGNDLIVFKKDI
jgi:GNAT superfamily N-acetyltransferase